MGDINRLFAQGLAGNSSSPAVDKPAVAITAPFKALGINGADAKGVDNFNSQGLTGNDIFKAPDEGGKAMLSWSSKPDAQKQNWVQRLMTAAANDLGIGKIKTESSSSSGGGSSGGDSGGSSSSGSFASSGGGGSAASSGGSASSSGGGSSTSFRGGSSDASLSSAIASVQGMDLSSMNAHLVGAAAAVHIDHTPAPLPPVVAKAPSADEISLWG